MLDTEASIAVRNLRKDYGEVRAIDDLTFTVKRGEVVGFLGPNGAGKSTTAKILTCFMSATGGEAKVAGYDVYSQAQQVRRKVGYLPEHNPLYADMLVHDYLQFAAEIRGVPRKLRAERIREMGEVCGISHVMHRAIKELSKGYRQRVGLAQAMIHEPEVLILDEPTSGLDPNQIVEIRDVIKAIGKHKTVVLSTHILQEVTAVCDRILIINQGRLVADGTIDEIRAKAGMPNASLEDVFRHLTGGPVRTRLDAVEPQVGLDTNPPDEPAAQGARALDSANAPNTDDVPESDGTPEFDDADGAPELDDADGAPELDDADDERS